MKCWIFMHRAKFQCHASSQLSSTSLFSSFASFPVTSPLVPATPVTLTPQRWRWIPAAASSPWSTTTTVSTSGTSRTSAKWASLAPSSSIVDVYGTWRYVLINPLAPGKFEWNFRYVIFKRLFSDWWLRYLLRNYSNMHVTGLHWWSVNMGSGNGLVPSGNKPLPEPMLTQIYVAVWRH